MKPQIKELEFTKEVYKATEGMRESFGLHIDQIGELEAEIIDVINGHSQSKDFVDHIITRLEVDKATAIEIAKKVNQEIFVVLRNYMMEPKQSSTEDNTSLEQAGGFEIEHEIPGNGEAGAERASREAAAFTNSDKVNMMSSIENPTPTISRTEQKGSAYTRNDPMTEPLVDQLLRGSTASLEQKINIATDSKPVPKAPMNASQPPANLPTNDPYREAMK